MLESSNGFAGSGSLSPDWSNETSYCVSFCDCKYYWSENCRESIHQEETWKDDHSQRFVRNLLRLQLVSLHCIWTELLVKETKTCYTSWLHCALGEVYPCFSVFSKPVGCCILVFSLDISRYENLSFTVFRLVSSLWSFQKHTQAASFCYTRCEWKY